MVLNRPRVSRGERWCPVCGQSWGTTPFTCLSCRSTIPRGWEPSGPIEVKDRPHEESHGYPDPPGRADHALRLGRG